MDLSNMFNFLSPKKFFLSEIKWHKIFNYVKDCSRFDNENYIILNSINEIFILDKNFEVLYKENINDIKKIAIINNEQFIGIKLDKMFLFSIIFSNDINSDNPNKSLNKQIIIKLNSECVYDGEEKIIMGTFFYYKKHK